ARMPAVRAWSGRPWRAGLFLEKFVAGIPWAHIDIAGTSRVETDKTWRSKGATALGARLLTELACSFAPPKGSRHGAAPGPDGAELGYPA
ncbi:MAG: hypothetical protein L0227_00875, partial [Chloroflexi bacterium]|nr:hypothetical protein [Chloroflexota bacterium]